MFEKQHLMMLPFVKSNQSYLNSKNAQKYNDSSSSVLTVKKFRDSLICIHKSLSKAKGITTIDSYFDSMIYSLGLDDLKNYKDKRELKS